jgi:hypothetical protein
VPTWTPSRTSTDTGALMNTGTVDPRTGMPKTGPAAPRTAAVPPPGASQGPSTKPPAKPSTRPTATRPPPRPESENEPKGVDALLERLRARRADRD